MAPKSGITFVPTHDGRDCLIHSLGLDSGSVDEI